MKSFRFASSVGITISLLAGCVTEALLKPEYSKVSVTDIDGNKVPELITEITHPFIFKAKGK